MNILCLDELGNLHLKLDPIHDSNLRKKLFGFFKIAKFTNIDNEWLLPRSNDKVKFLNMALQIQNKFIKSDLPLKTCPQLSEKLFSSIHENSFDESAKNALKIKQICPICDEKWDEHNENQLKTCQEKFQPEISSNFKRKLMNYQKKSVQHLIEIKNGANFSVPGSGKTTVTYAAISKLLEDGIINKILVIGPTASFFPWEFEYEQCFGEQPDSKRISGNDANDLSRLDYPMFLMHFATVMYKTQQIIDFLEKPENKVVVIIDESHNVKNIDEGKWSEAVTKISPYATRRIVLTGTPMPQSAADLWIQLNFLWPYGSNGKKLLGDNLIFKDYTQKHGLGRWRETVSPLFTRVTKKELGLDTEATKPTFNPVYVDLFPNQRQIYNLIAERTLDEIYDFSTRGKLHEIREGRFVRLMQAASNPALIDDQDDEFSINDEYGFNPKVKSIGRQGLDAEILEKIEHYTKTGEIPSKLIQVEKLTRKLIENNEKVIIWSNYLKNIRVLQNQLLKDLKPIAISGEVSKDPNDNDNRDNLINDFKNSDEPQVLIATPPSLSESVSLHINSKKQRVCNHAIYLDRNYNAAQFIQSMDRIHRLGMDTTDNSSFTVDFEDLGKRIERTFKRNQVYYHLFIAKNTTDEDINDRLWEKFENMNVALNDDWPSSLDYDGKRVVVSKNQSQKDFNSFVNNLKKTINSNKQ